MMSKGSEAAKVEAYVLLIAGTAGLLLNELVFDWGRVATLSLALSNAVGLVILGLAALGIGKASGE